jgi:hypothetical protein
VSYDIGAKVRVVRGEFRGRLGEIVDHKAMLLGIDRVLLPSTSAMRLRERYQASDSQRSVKLEFDFVTGAPQETTVIDLADLRPATRFQSGL